MLEDLPEQMQDILYILRGSIGEQVEQGHAVLDEDVPREIRVGLADTTNDGDALKRCRPVRSLDVGVQLDQQLLV